MAASMPAQASMSGAMRGYARKGGAFFASGTMTFWRTAPACCRRSPMRSDHRQGNTPTPTLPRLRGREPPLRRDPLPRKRGRVRVGAMYRIGIDVGGTFTDLVAIDAGGATMLAKVPSTPEDPSLGVLYGLALFAGRLGLERGTLLSATERIVHGTTVATNALLERKGARTGLLTTEGHRDVIEMREGLKDDRYNLRMPPPEQLVPRRLRLGVRERLRADGRVETPLDPASLDRVIAVLQREGVEAVAVCYLHAYRDPSHERATRAAIERALPGIYVSLSSDVLPQIKEFERVSTTV